ncbi:hypothetical protein KIN20_025369 [Parelaphostrongylus tenuis]|uniref:Uncharacterized protein n=1 Tax=Parelaphostrongylus tenuis TaxID=148309 RepID=A0AAD5QX77_PARTN|nr:hypothetical protein KIN20_025369 [Parelaphostrongylus tenuis]
MCIDLHWYSEISNGNSLTARNKDTSTGGETSLGVNQNVCCPLEKYTSNYIAITYGRLMTSNFTKSAKVLETSRLPAGSPMKHVRQNKRKNRSGGLSFARLDFLDDVKSHFALCLRLLIPIYFLHYLIGFVYGVVSTSTSEEKKESTAVIAVKPETPLVANHKLATSRKTNEYGYHMIEASITLSQDQWFSTTRIKSAKLPHLRVPGDEFKNKKWLE